MHHEDCKWSLPRSLIYVQEDSVDTEKELLAFLFTWAESLLPRKSKRILHVKESRGFFVARRNREFYSLEGCSFHARENRWFSLFKNISLHVERILIWCSRGEESWCEIAMRKVTSLCGSERGTSSATFPWINHPWRFATRRFVERDDR